MINLFHPDKNIEGTLSISGSKSESNRLLILQALFSDITEIKNLSTSEDTEVLRKALKTLQTTNDKVEINIGHAGTAMRFLTAFCALQEGKEILLTGSDRMKNRPIHPLVDALNALGADIRYAEKQGYPPLQIVGTQLTENTVQIPGNISSQFITALMLIGAKMPNGITIQWSGKLTSRPYVEMTQKLLEEIGVTVIFSETDIQVKPLSSSGAKSFSVESDWSSASYWYSFLALAKSGEVTLTTFKPNSKQGDHKIAEVFRTFLGVETKFFSEKIQLSKMENFNYPLYLELDLNEMPDLAQTLAVTCAGLRMPCKFTGLETLKIKETDRLLALQIELKKIGVETEITNDSIALFSFSSCDGTPQFDTYQDHRMAMSFAPLALLYPIEINEPEVVKKSYPAFWEDLKRVGFSMNEI